MTESVHSAVRDLSLSKPEVDGSVGGPLSWRLKFNPGQVYLGFVVDERVFSFLPLKVNDDSYSIFCNRPVRV